MNQYTIHTDGSCSGNPGPGGWGAVIEHDGKLDDISGGEYDTTNNRMEITAVIKGLEHTPEGSTVRVRSDSEYVVKTMTRGWKRKMNRDLWVHLDRLVSKRDVHFTWVRGHNGDTMNEAADALAVKAMQDVKRIGFTNQPTPLITE